MKKNACIGNIVEEKLKLATEVNDLIWDFAETKFQEYKSAELQMRVLEEEGFTIEKNIGDIPTAFLARYGAGGPVVGILGEYDALPGLSQMAECGERTPIVEGSSGHGCGHNTLGAGSLLAAISVKTFMAQANIAGTVIYFGCPGEEGGAGKAFMVRAGVFDNVDVALTWHPHCYNAIIKNGSLANARVLYKFKGTSAHAAEAPYLGRSALDGVELMNIGSNYLREHIIPSARLHYAIVNTGGVSPNVVQKDASVIYAIRAPRTSQMKEILEGVDKIAEGAALMTGTSVEKAIISGYAEYIGNDTLSQIIENNLKDSLSESYTPEEEGYGEKFKVALTKYEIEKLSDPVNRYAGWQGEYDTRPWEKAICDSLCAPMAMIGSTDVGDVSWNVPTAQFFTTCYAMGTPLHSWQLVAQGKSKIAHKGLANAARVLAATALDLLEKPELISVAKAELKQKRSEEKYECVIPEHVKPECD